MNCIKLVGKYSNRGHTRIFVCFEMSYFQTTAQNVCVFYLSSAAKSQWKKWLQWFVVIKQVSKKCQVLPTAGLFLEIKSSFLSEQVITDTLEHEPQKIRQIRLNTQRKHIYNLGNTVLCLVFVDSMCKTCYYTCTCEHKHTQFPFSFFFSFFFLFAKQWTATYC